MIHNIISNKSATQKSLSYTTYYIRRTEEEQPFRERGSAPERIYIYIYIYIHMYVGRHSTIFLFHQMHLCSGSLMVWHSTHQQLVPRSRIPRSTSRFSYALNGALAILSPTIISNNIEFHPSGKICQKPFLLCPRNTLYYTILYYIILY